MQVKKKISYFICIIIFFATGSCNGDNRNNKKNNNDQNATGILKFAYLRYDSAAIGKRLDSLQVKNFIMQFYLPETGNNRNVFQTVVFVQDSIGDYPNSWTPDTLEIVNDYNPISFSGKMFVGNNEISREQFDNILTDITGKKFSFDYILFKPVLEGVFYHVVYQLQLVKNNTILSGSNYKIQMSTPTPPERPNFIRN
jgi:hypothetical protein